MCDFKLWQLHRRKGKQGAHNSELITCTNACHVNPQAEGHVLLRPQLAAQEHTQRRTLVVFDFDWSLVEENSDTWVLDQLGAASHFQQAQSRR